MFIYEHQNWTRFTWSDKDISGILARICFLQGKLTGILSAIGFDVRKETDFESLSQEILKSNEIEGVMLNTQEVRSSVARRLDFDFKKSLPTNHFLDGIVDMMLDATQNCSQPMTVARLCAWHASLFPTGYSGMTPIKAGQLRDDALGEMQVVSYKGSTEVVHYQAPAASELPELLEDFCDYINGEIKIPLPIKAAIAHLWFVTLHPFEDGNGRIARAVTEFVLSHGEDTPCRFYSMSGQIQKDKKNYYLTLEATQRGTSDITLWLKWFLTTLWKALQAAEKTLESISVKARFWQSHAGENFTEEQKKILNMLLDGTMRGQLTSSRWAKICKTSQDTAIRHIKDLQTRSILMQEGAGRSTHYRLSKNAIGS